MPVSLSGSKFYGVAADPAPARAAFAAALGANLRLHHETQEIAGHPVLRVALPD
ncbi:hypothetical protein ACIBLA_32195 [Streptomyces sp. NPDC050433]|uniref:hypothetical protein n=1 Tax=unclassified Streptomyces TaxID=2593676 RepID=UPI00343255D3